MLVLIGVVFSLVSSFWQHGSLVYLNFSFTKLVLWTAKYLTNFTIMVHMEDIYRSNPRVDEKNKCASFKGMFRNGERKQIDCLREMKGKYVTIVKEPPGPLEFCQVQVMGYSFRGNMFLWCMFFDFI